ncbi:MAG: hypothetical protein OCD02_21570 [Spirochaetaceae bacterium]
MRICVAFSSLNDKKIETFAKEIVKGLEKQTNSNIDLIDIAKDSDKRLTGYSYLIFGCSKTAFFNSKVDKTFLQYLKNSGQITGKHTFVYTAKKFGDQKFLNNLMRALESEGVLLKSSSVISSKEQAKIIGSKLHIK